MSVKFINPSGIPEHIVQAIIQDDHITNGDISVTQLIDAPQIRMLKKSNNYTMDVMDLIPAFMGTGLHTVLERADTAHRDVINIQRAITSLSGLKNKESVIKALRDVITNDLKHQIDSNSMKEVNLQMEVIMNEGEPDEYIMTLSGTLDLFQILEKHLQDYKQTKASSFIYPDFVKSWHKQLNVYATMLRLNGFEVKKASVHAFFKDWTKIMTLQNSAYPKSIYKQIDIPLKEHEPMMRYIRSRVDLHHRAEMGEEIPCTPEERWQKADVYKVFKVGGKRSLRNWETKEQAESFIEELKLKSGGIGLYEVRFVPGQSFRCMEYCPVASFCPQYKEELRLLSENTEKFED